MMLSEKGLSQYASFLLDGGGRSDEEDEDNAVMIENFIQMDSANLDARFEAIMQRHNHLVNFASAIE